MIEVKEETFETTLRKVLQSLKPSESKLISFTKRIESINPLHFFEAGYSLHMNRTFWMSTIDNFAVVGIGNAYSINQDKADMRELQEQWNTLLQEAITINPFSVPGTGVIAIGGMDFDPRKPKTPLWDHFSSSELRIPKFLLTVRQGDSYLTSNVYVNGNDRVASIYEELMEIERELLSPNEKEENIPTILRQQEIQPIKWKNTVKLATETMANGQAEKIVLARELRLDFEERVQLTDILQGLLETQPTSYIFAYEQEGDCFIGASPERLVKVENNQLLSTCLAGTAPRGQSEIEDEKIGYQLLHDKKNLEEHDFVVQMIKQSIEEFCDDLQIPDKPILYKLRNLQHLYTPVRGLLKEGYTIFDVVKKLHPTPALGGEPREEALSFIREYEHLDRGWYGAPFGWIDSNHNGEFAVAIRSGLIQGNKASLFAGCGVVKDSDPEAEFVETSIKFLPMLTVLGG
ncbi:isochorismate synthase [Ornithinibacillus scapharcae]|uniref:isochorismate synthase n=1 Tax=Ornithinibacillus scapharcae TaxID=1147159 RepID=UPI000225B66B|nr:isochorismate synthase [Ornithinibacillus scapharcae]